MMHQHRLYKNDAEERQHHAAITHLAEHLHHSELGVRPLYEIVLARFNRTARIRDFLTVLVSRRVQALMRMRTTESDPFDGKRHGSSDL
jgi:hypothetical protein